MFKLLEPREYYKPFDYPWAYDYWKTHESMHWLGFEVPLHADVKDWEMKLTKNEQELMKNLFRFFTQADVDVAGGYVSTFLPLFSHKPELVLMMSSFAAREAVHQDAYALLLETMGMPEETYKEFSNFKEMMDKHEYLERFKKPLSLTDFENFKSKDIRDSDNLNNIENDIKRELNTRNIKELCLRLAVYSGFTEGMQLFGSFVILLNFPRFNKMKNMGNIIAWSVRDEQLHVKAMTKLYRNLVKEYITDPEDVAELRQEVFKIGAEMTYLEEAFVDLCFTYPIEGLTKEEVKNYIRYICNMRLSQLGYGGCIPLFPNNLSNPLPWVDIMINGQEHANFFESKSTSYAKGMVKGEVSEW